MDLSEIVGITGLPGLFKIAGRRNDGAIVTSLLDGKTQFVSSRTNALASLDNISIFTTTEEPAMLKEVLAAIKKNEAATPVPDVKDDAALKAWLEVVLPVYDKEKVHVSDMRKLAKWYNLLNEKNLIEELTAEKATEETTESKEEVAKDVKKESKPKVIKTDKSAKAHTKPAPVKKITTPRKAS
jgi:hypothetical protein